MKNKPIAFSNDQKNELLDKIKKRQNFTLGDSEVAQGIVGAPDQCFIVKDISNFTDKEKKYLKSFHTSATRYLASQSLVNIFYLSEKNFANKKIEDYPNIMHHFEVFKKLLGESKIKYKTPNKPYFYLHRERDEKFFMKGAKVISQSRSFIPSFCYTEKEYYGSRALNFIKTDRINLKYLTALLNSSISYFWLKNRGKQLGDLLQVDKGPLLAIPILKTSAEKEKIIVELVDKMLELNQDLQKEKQGTNKHNHLQSEITRTNKIIDEKVYKLYGLSKKEIEIIEKGEK